MTEIKDTIGLEGKRPAPWLTAALHATVIVILMILASVYQSVGTDYMLHESRFLLVMVAFWGVAAYAVCSIVMVFLMALPGFSPSLLMLFRVIRWAFALGVAFLSLSMLKGPEPKPEDLARAALVQTLISAENPASYAGHLRTALSSNRVGELPEEDVRMMIWNTYRPHVGPRDDSDRPEPLWPQVVEGELPTKLDQDETVSMYWYNHSLQRDTDAMEQALATWQGQDPGVNVSLAEWDRIAETLRAMASNREVMDGLEYARATQSAFGRAVSFDAWCQPFSDCVSVTGRELRAAWPRVWKAMNGIPDDLVLVNGKLDRDAYISRLLGVPEDSVAEALAIRILLGPIGSARHYAGLVITDPEAALLHAMGWQTPAEMYRGPKRVFTDWSMNASMWQTVKRRSWGLSYGQVFLLALTPPLILLLWATLVMDVFRGLLGRAMLGFTVGLISGSAMWIALALLTGSAMLAAWPMNVAALLP